MQTKYDLIILGAGPAGLSAGIYAARYGLQVLIIGKEFGGMINYATIIENYPGFTGSGLELAKKFAEQAKCSGAEILQREIVNIKKEKEFEVQTLENEIFKARAIIISLGTEKRKLNIKGEEEFLGRGVSYCATCDAPLFKGKSVAVIGGRNSAAHATLLLSRYAKKVYVIYRKGKLNCDAFLVEQVKQNKNAEVVCDALPVRIEGNGCVADLIIERQGKQKKIPVDGIFVEIGSVPVTSLAKNLGLKLDNEGYIIVDREMKTNIQGIFAAGDINANSLKQIIVASSQGAIAASSAYKFLKEKK